MNQNEKLALKAQQTALTPEQQAAIKSAEERLRSSSIPAPQPMPGAQIQPAAQPVQQPDTHGSYDQLMVLTRKLYADGNLEGAKKAAELALQAKQGNPAVAKPEQGPPVPRPTPGAVGGASGAMLDGGMMGFGDEYMAGLSSVLGVQPDGQGGAHWFDYSKPIGERYNNALGAIRDEQKAFRENRPGLSMAAEVTGAIVGPGKGSSAFINAGKSTAGRMGRGGLAGGSAATAYGYGEGEDGIEARLVSGISNAPLGIVGGGTLTGLGQGFNSTLQALSKRPEAREAIPTIEGLKEVAGGLYERARAAGGELTEPSMKGLANRAQSVVRDLGFDAQLHPRVAAVLSRLSNETGPKSLQDLDILRRVASNAAESTQPDERRIASRIIDEIDEAVDGLGEGSAALREARDTWARMRRLELIETAIEKASLQDNFAAGLRNQFKALLRNPKRLRGFEDAQIKAVRQVAQGTATVKALRGLSGLLSPTGLPGMALAGGTALAGLGIVPALGVAATGLGTKAVASALTAKGAESARRTVGQSDAQRMVAQALLKKPNRLAGSAGLTGPLGEALRNRAQ